MKKLLPAALMTCLATVTAIAEVLPLWPEGVPNAKPRPGPERVADGRTFNVTEPTLTVVAPPPSFVPAAATCARPPNAKACIMHNGWPAWVLPLMY